MITIKDIQKWSKPHPIGKGGRMTNIFNRKYELSIVGGAKGLYGDFDETFEVAILDTKDRNFVTMYFFPEIGEDVIGYMNAEKLEELANSIFRNNGFQVR
jgi:hypothetical protein